MGAAAIENSKTILNFWRFLIFKTSCHKFVFLKVQNHLIKGVAKMVMKKVTMETRNFTLIIKMLFLK